MNRTTKDATLKRYHYDTHWQFEAHLTDLISPTSRTSPEDLTRPHALRLTPYEFMYKA